MKSSELHKIPESVVSTIVANVAGLFEFVMQSLSLNITSIFHKTPNISSAQKLITQHFQSFTYNIFKEFQTTATRRSYIKRTFGLIVSYSCLDDMYTHISNISYLINICIGAKKN